ncbi:MAG: hypothetical protein GHCLOJNM_03859 [bacterium]|nr:hypothetical protein [bacterium]
MNTLLLAACLLGATSSLEWRHPAGMITEQTLHEVREKLDTQAWARKVYEGRKKELLPWAEIPSETLAKVFPTYRSNVYHNFSCPKDRTPLTYDPFNPDEFHCPACGATYPPDVDAGVYPPGDRYHGNLREGWACHFYLKTPGNMVDLAVIGRLEGDARWMDRGIELLMLFAKTVRALPTDRAGKPQEARILTYQREGESGLLIELARAYELLRERMSAAQRATFENDVLRRMLNDVILDPIYPYDHNNVTRYHHVVLQTALSLEDADRIDWCFGRGDFSTEKAPEHRSLTRILSSHFKPDGAFWELCSGYHLYPLHALCEVAVLSHHLSEMDPQRFPAEKYDLATPENPSAQALKNALEWFMSMAMPDRTMPTVGDSMSPRAGMEDYYSTAEVGYRFFDMKSVGDYDKLREGGRSWFALLHGAPELVKSDTPFTSSYLSSGWVSLRNNWNGNRVWVGLNALAPGGGHQHADRLGLTYFSRGELLALEKATPYNELTTRELGTLSSMHNTVTVDKTSQKQGEALQGVEIPEVAAFHDGPLLKFAELRADRLYPQTTVYRRSVAVIEDVVVDVFRVEGGETHDWMLHHAGGPPTVSIPLVPAVFEPREWLAFGSDRVFRGVTADVWSAQWRVGDVTSRVTLLGATGTEVYTLETYPIDRAVVTAEHPPCQTLCVRRTTDAPFVAIWDAWKESPNLLDVAVSPDNPMALRITTRSGVFHLLFGAGKATFRDGPNLESDGLLLVSASREEVCLVGGTRARICGGEADTRFTLSRAATAMVSRKERGEDVLTWETLQHDTRGGRDYPRGGVAIKAETKP